MSSSYVEVRESENGTDGSMLQFEIDPCESNGMDLPSHLDGDPPKDHTYNKDPEVVEDDAEFLPEENELADKKDEAAEVKKTSKTTKSSRQKTSRSKSVEKATKSPIKKVSRKKASQKEQTLKPMENPPDVIPDISSESVIKAESPEPPSEPSPKKKSRKRKAENNASAPADETKESKVAADASPNKAEPDEEIEKEPTTDVAEEESPKPTKRIKPSKELPQKRETKIRNSKKEKEESPKAPSKPKAVAVKQEKSVKGDKDVGLPHVKLPEGWTYKIVERKSGKTAGLFDIYFYSPDGIKCRSKPDIAAYLARVKSNLTVDHFSLTKKELGATTSKPVPEKKKVAVKSEEIKPSPKVTGKPKKKATTSPLSPSGKKGQKLVVKLDIGKSKSRSQAANDDQKGNKKLKPEDNKTTVQKAAASTRRKK